MICCKRTSPVLIREDDGHRMCASCNSHEYLGILIYKKLWDEMMEVDSTYLEVIRPENLGKQVI